MSMARDCAPSLIKCADIGMSAQLIKDGRVRLPVATGCWAGWIGPTGWEQTGSSAALHTALNGAQPRRTALYCAV
ncbi:hypothetical protein Val02_75260 [Virgisporangium aliadipatigenens]|uniref:Uncharacterized protein n=1 Tax=Virgisporangium aliadipatigenens TaxID=741659 RepID=A0A8J3YVJ4_9ACTN|nr:hypothetical protein Val02_75260 [Virgisporangium aliadipatigenens]